MEALRTDIAEVRTEMKAMEDRLIEAFRDSQTELLKASTASRNPTGSG